LLQIVNLGAGSDSTYFRLQSENYLINCTYVEVEIITSVHEGNSTIEHIAK